MSSTTSTNGSTVTYIHNPDGSYVETVVYTDAQGAVTTTVYFVNALNQLMTEDVSNPDGSTSHQAYNYFPDGSYQQVMESLVNADGSHSDVTYTYNSDGSLQQTMKDAIAADGSRVDTAISYSSDHRSYQEVVTASAANGQVTSTTSSYVDAQGQLISKEVNTPAGTDDRTQYQYFPSGALQQVTEDVFNADGSHTDSITSYNSDGTYAQVTKDAIAADGSRVNTRISYNSDQSYQETVTISAPYGPVTSTTYSFVNAQGQLIYRDVTTPTGTSHTDYVYFRDGSSAPARENIFNADGSHSESMSYYGPDGLLQQSVKNAVAADGTRVDTTINYNWDRSHQETITATAVNGQVTSATNSFFNSQGQLMSKDVSTPAGTDHTQYQYFANSGHYQQVVETIVNADGSRSDSMESYNPDGTYALVTRDAIAADGSRVDTTINYNSDRSHQETVTAAAANGQVTSTTISLVNSLGQLMSKDVSTSTGTDHTQYQYYWNGPLQQVTETIVNADGSRSDSSTDYNLDGTFAQLRKDAIAADGSRVDSVLNYNADQSYQETDTAISASGQVTSTTNSIVNTQGQTVDKVVNTPSGTVHTQYQYNPDGSYQATVVTLDANGQQISQNTYTVPISGATYAYNPDGSYAETVIQTDAAGATTTTVYYVDAQGQFQQSTKEAIAADGSRVETSIGYNSDRSRMESIVVFAANGDVLSRSTSFVNVQGQVTFKDVSTPTGTDHTDYQYAQNGQYQQVTEHIVNTVDGSRTDVTSYYGWNGGSLQQTIKETNAADGSRVETRTDYRPDGSHNVTVTATARGGVVTSTTSTDFNFQGHVIFKDVSTPAGTDHTQYQYFQNGSGPQQVSENVVNVDGSRSDSVTNYNSDGTYAQITKDAIAADGSRVDTTANYSYDQSYQETATATSATGQMTSRTDTFVNAQGQVMFKNVNTPAGMDFTHYDYFQNGGYQEVDETVTNADGSRSDSMTRYNADRTYAQIVKDTIAADGSRIDTTINYSYDQSYQEMVTATAANGQVTSTTNSFANAQGQVMFKDVSTSGGMYDHTQYQYFASGGYQQVWDSVSNADGSRSDSMTNYNPDGSYAQITKDAIAADGSRVDTTMSYNSDRSHQETATATSATGQVTSTTNSFVNAQGQVMFKDVSTPAGSDHTDYQYFADGEYQRMMEHVVNADGSRSDASYYYNWDGTYHQIVKDTIAADGSRVDTTLDYNPDGSYKETVVSTAANGQQLNQNTYAVSLDGSYSDMWVSRDGSHGNYAWDASSSEYQANWYDSNATYWTDDYQYAAGGSPQTGGASFFETYTSSEGSHGTRQYDASTGLANIAWDSSATGSLSGTSQTAAGFVGLQNDGELTNNQSDLTFFNPAASPGFAAFLTSFDPHA